MKCSWIYKNKKFNSELELDDFLLNKGEELYSIYGDSVFSKSTPQMYVMKQCEDLKEKGSQELKKKFKQKHDKNIVGDNDIEYEDVEDPYVGVTKFLSGLINQETGKLFFPNFIPDEGMVNGQKVEGYFPRKYQLWENNVFTTREIQDFFDGDKQKSKQNFTRDQLQEFRKILENKWEQQGLIGTEIHKVLYNIFKTSQKGTEMYKLSEEQLFDYIKDKINSDLLSEDNLRDIISYGKRLYKKITDQIGEDLTFYPEFIVWGNYIDNTGTEKEVLGKIDLLAVDKLGNIHIFDYKTSPDDFSKPFDSEEGYSSVKVQAFKYQLSTYNLLLQQLGIGGPSTKIYVAPIQLLNFKRDEDKWGFNKIKAYPEYFKNILDSLSESAKIEADLKQYFKDISTPDIGIENFLTTYDENVKKFFNDVPSDGTYTEEDINSLIKNRAAQNKETGIWEYKTGRGNLKTFKTREDLYNWLKNYLEYNKIYIESFTKKLVSVIDNYQEDIPILQNDNYSTYEFKDGYATWINEIFKKYYSDDYKIINTEMAKQLQNLGIILVENVNIHTVDAIKISNSVLYGYKVQTKGQKKISSKFVVDVEEESNPNSKILESLNGNIELMTTMLALNEVPGDTLRGKTINEIRVINPNLNSSISAPQEQLMYTFNRLDYYSQSKGNGIKKNNFKNLIKLNNSYDLFINEYRYIIRKHMNQQDRRWKSFISATSNYDKIITGIENPIEFESDLRNLIKDMEKHFPELQGDIKDVESTNDVVMLYKRAISALSYIKGIDYVQQYTKSDRLLDSVHIFKSGVSGTRIDNPGNLKNKNLNKATELTTRGYQNVRERLEDTKIEIRKAVEQLKKRKNFGFLKSHTFGNKADLFRNLYRKVDGDFWFKDENDSSLIQEERDLLKLALRLINKNRYGTLSDAELQVMKDKSPSKYYKVPLTPGKANSYISVNGLKNTLKHKLKSLTPANIKQEFINKEENLLGTIDAPNHALNSANIWKMTTMFDAGESEKSRQDLLNTYQEGYFEHDLETLLLKHSFSYLQKEVMDDILPLIKAGVLDIQYQQTMAGTRNYFQEDIDYLMDYVKNKIHNKSLVDDKFKAIMGYKSKIMRLTSAMALGFNPKQLYQEIEGLWKDIKLVITKPDGKYSFSSQDMTKSFFDVFKEAFHFGNVRSKLELINEYYALNDMDMEPNTYAERLIDDKSLLYNFQTLCFRFASRPDFYNRLAIFESHMRADGCWEAHSVVDGKLVYDWKLDKRFNKLAKLIESNSNFESVESQIRNSSNKELKKQLALYKVYINQMAKEGTKIKQSDGTYRLIQEGDILPKAYTTQQSEAYKSISDMLYGYYAHEKKALIQSELAGSLLLQMYTYWSGKKNQYLAPGSPKVMGRYEQLERNGKLYFLDENGNPTEDEKITGIPYMVWKGQFQEGILVTLNHMKKLLQQGFAEEGLVGGLSKGRKLWDEEMFGDEVDPNLRTAYLYNLKAISYDIAIWMLIGQWAARNILSLSKQYVKENEADNLSQALTNEALMLGSNLLKSSAMDFNFMESIGGRGIDWTPFSISMMTNTYNNARLFLMGKQDFLKSFEKSVSGARQLHELTDYLFREN